MAPSTKLYPVGNGKFLKFNSINMNVLKRVQEITEFYTGIKYKIEKNTGRKNTGYRINIGLNKELSIMLLGVRNNPTHSTKFMNVLDKEEFIKGLICSSGISGFIFDNTPHIYLRTRLSEKHFIFIKEVLSNSGMFLKKQYGEKSNIYKLIGVSKIFCNHRKFRKYISSSETICGTIPLEKRVAYTLFGDGSLVKTSPNSAQIKFEHCKKQKKWLLYKMNNLNEFFPELKIRYRESKNTFGAQGKSNNFLGDLRRRFYPNNKKSIIKLLPFLDEISLAWWFMDDGDYEKIGNCFKISMFIPKEDIDEVKLFLEEKFNLHTRYRTNKGIVTGLIFGAEKRSREKFVQIISPYMIPSMLYKLGRGFEDRVQLDVSNI